MLVVAVLVVLGAALSHATHARALAPPKASRVLVKKSEHVLLLYAPSRDGRETVIARYSVAIGPGGLGPKRKEGDMTTPVGRYHVVSHEASQYRTFLRLDYPTVDDWRRFALAKERGELPANARIGSDIGIHGPPRALDVATRAALKSHDWTAGCIALDDHEIDELARSVTNGTVVDIEP